MQKGHNTAVIRKTVISIIAHADQIRQQNEYKKESDKCPDISSNDNAEKKKTKPILAGWNNLSWT